MSSNTKSEADKRARDIARLIGFAGFLVNTAVVFGPLFLMKLLGYGSVELLAVGYGLNGASVGTMIAVFHAPGVGMGRIVLAFAANDTLALVLSAGALFVLSAANTELHILAMVVWLSVLLSISVMVGTRLLRPANSPGAATGGDS